MIKNFLNKNILRLVVSFSLMTAFVSLGNAAEHVTSPDGRISLTVGLKSGKPYYTVNYKERLRVGDGTSGMSGGDLQQLGLKN